MMPPPRPPPRGARLSAQNASTRSWTWRARLCRAAFAEPGPVALWPYALPGPAHRPQCGIFLSGFGSTGSRPPSGAPKDWRLSGWLDFTSKLFKHERSRLRTN
jgi:hypothetical protein